MVCYFKKLNKKSIYLSFIYLRFYWKYKTNKSMLKIVTTICVDSLRAN